MSASSSVQEHSQSLWDDITSTYERARAAGAAYQTDINTELYMDPQLGIEFVLRVAAALRDKPKPPKDRHASPTRSQGPLVVIGITTSLTGFTTSHACVVSRLLPKPAQLETAINVASPFRISSMCSGQKHEQKNPFLPYEETLWVRHVSPTHTLLLNKFNVVAHHLICVTRDFQQQTEPLTAADMDATWTAMQVMPSPLTLYPDTVNLWKCMRCTH
jgi:ATP adenylyltransferase